MCDFSEGVSSTKAEDVLHVLRDRVALLPGSRDRYNRPVIIFPTRENSPPVSIDNIRNVLIYLHNVTADEFKERGFVIIIDMRRGTPWANVKPILKCLQDFFPAHVHVVFIIKPDKFWEKHKASVSSSGKYKFNLQMISVEDLVRSIDLNQLTRDLGGTLFYDHDEWMECRLDLENLIWRMTDVMRNFEVYSNEMKNGNMPFDVDSAKRAIEEHKILRSKIFSINVEELELQARNIQRRIKGTPEGGTPDDGYNSSTSGGMFNSNPDIVASLPHLQALVNSIRSGRDQLCMQWEGRGKQLDHCSQLKLYEKDAEVMFNWTRTKSEEISCQFIEIGVSAEECENYLNEHGNIESGVENNKVNIQRLGTVARRLREVGNYGHKQIDATQMRVEDEWRRFTEKIARRTELLTVALSFHRQAAEYLQNSLKWLKRIDERSSVNAIVTQEQLESAVSAHDAFGDEEKQAYAFAIDDGRKVTQLMKSCTAGDPLGQNASYKRIVDLINQITRHHKEFHTKWETHKQRLYARLARNAFETDTQSVFNWLNEHGEPYLRKNTSIGENVSQAKNLLKHHLNFRDVAANTHGNAMKLYDAADQLINCGEVDDPKVRAEVSELKQRMSRFQEKVELRKNILSQSVLLHTHFVEIMRWFDGLEERQDMYKVASLSVEECEKRKEDFMKENDGTAQAFGTTMAECDRLVHSLQQQSRLMGIDSAHSIETVERIREAITQKNAAFAERHPSQRTALQLALKCANFVRNCNSMRLELQNWRKDIATMMNQTRSGNHIDQAGTILPYHEENTKMVRNAVTAMMSTAKEIIQGLEGIEAKLTTEEGDSLRDMVVNTARHLKEVEDDVMKFAISSQEQIHQALQVQHFVSLKSKLHVETARLEERMRSVTCMVPGNLNEALSAQNEHDHIRVELEQLHMKCREYCSGLEKMMNSDAADHQRLRDAFNEVNTDVQRLVGIFQERVKLINAAIACYRALYESVIPLLSTLEKDLTSTKDYCMELNALAPREKYEKVQEKLVRHNDYRERILKGCTYALKSSDLFLRYIQRCNANQSYVEHRLMEISEVKTDIYRRQANIQRLWPERKLRLETCLKATLYESSYVQRMDEIERQNAAFAEWCREGQKLRQLKTCSPQVLDEWSERFAAFTRAATEERNQVSKMLSLGDDFLKQIGEDIHAAELRRRLDVIRDRFGSFGSRLVEFGDQLAAARRVQPKGYERLKEDLSLNRLSNSRIEESLELATKHDQVDSKMRQPMLELIKSELDYIEDLRKCIECYIRSFRELGNAVPGCLKGRESEIFGNIEELFKFHRDTFVEELLKYENSPEDVGYCFIFWVEKLNALYTDYCVNKEQHNHLIALPEAISFFSNIRESHKLEHSQDLQSLVIKPVQRITRYRLMLEQLLKNCKTNVEEIREAHSVVVSVPKRANDIIHLKNFEGVDKLDGLGAFVMQDAFTVCEPKQYFKKGRDRQVFLFECCVVFAKKIEVSPKVMRYVYKNRLMINEIHICEHIEGDSTKFGLRQGSAPNSDLRTDLKASSEGNKVLWVRKIRELMQGLMTLNIETPNLGHVSSRSSRPSTAASSDRFSKDSSDFQDRNSLHSVASSLSNNLDNPQSVEHFVVVEDFVASEEGQLSLTKGQIVELVDQCAETPDWIMVVVEAEDGKESHARQGIVPVRVLTSVADSDAPDRPSIHEPVSPGASGVVKRKSLRRFFNHSNGSSSHSSQQQPQTSASGAPRPTSSVSLSVNHSASASSSSAHNRLSAADPLQPEPSTSNNDSARPTPTCVLSQFPSDSGTLLIPGQDEQASSSSHQPSASGSTADLQNPAATAVDLPPPMSQISSMVVDAAATASHLATGDLMDVAEGVEQNGGENVVVATTAAAPERTPEETNRLKRQYVLNELVETERDYVRDLTSVVEGYMAHLAAIELPEDLQGKDKIIFANIQQILEFHKTTFCKEIERCLNDYEAAGQAFVKYERRLHGLYVKYCQNKPKSDYLVSQEDFEQFFAEAKQKIGHKLALCDLLIKPVQRIMKYQLLLKDIAKFTQRAGDRTDNLDRALQVMHVVPKACDDMMQVGRLQNFDGNLNAQGKLIFQGTILISDNAPNQPFKGKDRRIFLFEQSAIIADCILPKKEFGNPTYIFKNQIMVNKMNLETNVPGEPLRFIIKSSDPSQPSHFLCQAVSEEEKQQYINAINERLDQQKEILAALVDPKRYQNQLANNVASMSLEDSRRSPASPFGAKKPTCASSTTVPSPASSSPKHGGGGTAKSKLFGFGKKSSSNNSGNAKSPTSPPPK